MRALSGVRGRVRVQSFSTHTLGVTVLYTDLWACDGATTRYGHSIACAKLYIQPKWVVDENAHTTNTHNCRISNKWPIKLMHTGSGVDWSDWMDRYGWWFWFNQESSEKLIEIYIAAGAVCSVALDWMDCKLPYKYRMNVFVAGLILLPSTTTLYDNCFSLLFKRMNDFSTNTREII